MNFELENYHRNTPDKELINDLKRVATTLKKDSVTIDEYNENGKFNATTLTRHFGSWFKSLEIAGLRRTRTLGVTNDEYFRNIEEVWTKIGRQPRYTEMQKPFSKYCAGAYEHRFGSWRKALEKFIEYTNSEKMPETKHTIDTRKSHSHRTKRSISWRLRFIIMRRDDFKCKICGRNPASDSNIVLHVDHIKSWSQGGETTPENLQTLCSKCNIGKNNL